MILTSLLAAILAVSALPSQNTPEEKTLNGADEAVIWFVSKKPRVKIETHMGVTFNLDFATHGALSLANMCAELKTQPKGLTLSFDPSAGMLGVGYDKDAKALRITFGGSHTPVCSVPLPLTMPITRVLLRQRDQLALYVIPESGDQVTLAWLGTVACTVEFRNASQYELCSDLKIKMGNRDIPYDDFRKGVKLTALDEIADVTVTGTDPGGSPFVHHYTFDYDALQKRADSAYANFLRAAGNTIVGGEALAPKGTPGTTPGTISGPGPSPNPSPGSAASPAPTTLPPATASGSNTVPASAPAANPVQSPPAIPQTVPTGTTAPVPEVSPAPASPAP